VGTLATRNDEGAAKIILQGFIRSNKTQLKGRKYRNNSLYDFIEEGYNEEKYLATFEKLIDILNGEFE
jgi:hypothetical protein